ncbi:hypothetical protein FCM35_KLT06015 [Carex littledalei]|uniref:Uncharacterized protein n=1 Tax=Carex littledalei TaxID=544730 RepID=A0A833QYP1_9POAL|nr:hypothetical protein FCM35_KLT06015 [Carex littledalei]
MRGNRNLRIELDLLQWELSCMRRVLEAKKERKKKAITTRQMKRLVDIKSPLVKFGDLFPSLSLFFFNLSL